MVKKSAYYASVDSKEEVFSLVNFYDDYKSKRMVASSKEASLAVNQAFKEKNERFFLFVKPKTDADAKKINRALRKLSKVRKKILMDMKNEKIENSFLGMLGRAMEPLTQYAGFDWRVNVSF